MHVRRSAHVNLLMRSEILMALHLFELLLAPLSFILFACIVAPKPLRT